MNAPSLSPESLRASSPASAGERLLGEAGTNARTTLVVTAGVHGNETAGIEAVRRVFARIRSARVRLRGRLVAYAGNLPALARRRRFLDRDLNRGWLPDTTARIAAGGVLNSEDREQLELLVCFQDAIRRAGGRRVTFLDLHSTSADGPPFVALSDTLRNRRIAFSLPVPVLLGLEERIEGTMLSWLDDLGHAALVFEGGRHDAAWTVRRLEAAVWLVLARVGAVDAAEVPELHAHRKVLAEGARGIPRVLEVFHRHAIAPGDRFRMRPGYRNFAPVRAGDVLADDARGPVACPRTALLLLPLYQEQGDDGFFLARPVARFWLQLSALLRRLRLHVLLPLLPGVRTVAGDPYALAADRRVARFGVVPVFHLFGYRHVAPEGERLVFRRRRPDHLPPAPPPAAPETGP